MGDKKKLKDYYEVLGVAKNATAKGIQLAFRDLARKYHPDVNSDPGAEDVFKTLVEAYLVLKNPDKRDDLRLKSSHLFVKQLADQVKSPLLSKKSIPPNFCAC